MEFMGTKKKLVSWISGNPKGVTEGKDYEVKSNGYFTDDVGNLREAALGVWVLPQDRNNELFSSVVSPMEILGELTSEANGSVVWKGLKPKTKESGKQAMRFNSGKPQLSYMLDADVAMAGMCKVFEFGAEKYARGNWKKGLDVNEILDSMLRHQTAYANGEVLDPESGLPHIDHITCNAVFLATFGDRDAN